MTVAPFPGKRSWLNQCILGDGKNPKALLYLRERRCKRASVASTAL
jgi:hypothetical protein